MARKPTLNNPLAKTSKGEPVDAADLDAGNIRTTGVGLRDGELQAVDNLAERLGVARNALLRFAIRWFILETRAGNVELDQFVEIPPEPKRRLKMP